MTAQQLQKDLAAELKNIFKGRKYSDPLNVMQPMNVFLQNLPIPTTDDAPDPFPYVIVKIDGGEIKEPDAAQDVSVNLLIGLYNDDYKNEGHLDVLEAINLIYAWFAENPILAQHYRMKDPVTWALQDEDTHPYFFGAVNTLWQTAAIRREDKYS